MDRAVAVDQVGLVLELLTADAVPARVDVLVDVVATVAADALEEVLDEDLVPFIRGADEEVVGGPTLCGNSCQMTAMRSA